MQLCNTNTLKKLGEQLSGKLSYWVIQLSDYYRPRDFFHLLADTIIPCIRKEKSYKSLIKGWKKEFKEWEKELYLLRQKAQLEINGYYDLLKERIHNSVRLQKIPLIKELLLELEGYITGKICLTCGDPLDKSVEIVGKICYQLIREDALKELCDIARVSPLSSSEDPIIEEYYFENSVNKVLAKNLEMSWEDMPLYPHFCWAHLFLLEQLWKKKTFEENIEIQDYEKIAEQLHLRAHWEELQSIRNQRSYCVSFYIIERFRKYIEIIGNEILNNGTPYAPTKAGILEELSLHLKDNLLLLAVKKKDRKEEFYVLYKFKGDSTPRAFFAYMIQHPGKEVVPSDVDPIYRNSSSNLLDRANFKNKGSLCDLFFSKETQRKGAIKLINSHVSLINKEPATKTCIEKEIIEMNLDKYK